MLRVSPLSALRPRRPRLVVAVALTAGLLPVLAATAPGEAATPPSAASIDFDSGYTVGPQTPDGQNGWDGHGNPAGIDWALVGSAGHNALRLSNAVTSGVQAQLSSPPVAPAGESAQASENTFTGAFTVASATGAAQNGLAAEVDVSNASASRVANLNLHVVDGQLNVGTYWVDPGASNADADSWRSTVVARVSASTSHRIGVTVRYLDGLPDALSISVDGDDVFQGTTWEHYYEVTGEPAQPADRLLFRAATNVPSASGVGFDPIAAAPQLAGKGFLFSGISYSTSSAPVSALTVRPGQSVQAAIDDVAPGGTVTLEPGTYSEELQIRKSVTIAGASAGSVILAQPASGTNKLVDVYNASNVTIRNLVLDGTARVAAHGTAATGLDVNSVDGLTLANVTTTGFGKNGIAITGRWKADTPTTTRDVSLTDVTSADNAWAGIAFYTRSSENVDAAITGVTLAGTTHVHGNRVGVQFGDDGDPQPVRGVADGPLALGTVVFADNGTSVQNSNGSALRLDRASTIDGRAVSATDFAPGTLVLTPALPTTTTLTAPTRAVPVGATVTLSASVTPKAAAGRVTILDGATAIASGALHDGAFAVSTAALSAGSHALKATFTPADADDYSASTSTTVPLTVNAKQQAAPPPAADTAGLDAMIEAQHLDVAGTTASFSAADGTAGDELGAIDPSVPLTGTLPWSNAADSFVDVYAYSTPIFLGTFPVIDGVVRLDGLDLSALEAGGHHLVFIGQTSKQTAVMALTVGTAKAASGVLADTGSDVAPWLMLALLLVGVGGVLAATRRRAHSG